MEHKQVPQGMITFIKLRHLVFWLRTLVNMLNPRAPYLCESVFLGLLANVAGELRLCELPTRPLA